MKKRIMILLLTVAMLLGGCLSVYAADHSIAYDVAYDSDKKVVTVTLFVENAAGLEAADFNLAYNTEMYEYVDVAEAEIGDDAMVVAGKAATDDGLATCSLIFMESCDASMLDDKGRLELATFSFSPKSSDYDTESFCYWVSSYSVGNVNLSDEINIVGKQDLMEDLTDAVTYIMPSTNNDSTTKSSTEGISGDLGSKWYVYVIAGVLAVGAIAGIAVVAIRSSRNEDEDKDNEETKENSAEESDKEAKKETKKEEEKTAEKADDNEE